MTWLVVEDDNDIRTVVAMMMTVWGENPLPFPDGRTAWAWLDSVENGTYQGELPELALMDIRMPGYTGDQIAERIRRTQALKHIPIVLMTAFSLTEAEVSVMRTRTGIDHLIHKPLPDFDSFKTMLYRIRDERKARASDMSVQAKAPNAPVAPPVTEPHAPAATDQSTLILPRVVQVVKSQTSEVPKPTALSTNQAASSVPTIPTVQPPKPAPLPTTEVKPVLPAVEVSQPAVVPPTNEVKPVLPVVEASQPAVVPPTNEVKPVLPVEPTLGKPSTGSETPKVEVPTSGDTPSK